MKEKLVELYEQYGSEWEWQVQIKHGGYLTELRYQLTMISLDESDKWYMPTFPNYHHKWDTYTEIMIKNIIKRNNPSGRQYLN